MTKYASEVWMRGSLLHLSRWWVSNGALWALFVSQKEETALHQCKDSHYFYRIYAEWDGEELLGIFLRCVHTSVVVHRRTSADAQRRYDSINAPLVRELKSRVFPFDSHKMVCILNIYPVLRVNETADKIWQDFPFFESFDRTNKMTYFST